jgi:cytochrome c6
MGVYKMILVVLILTVSVCLFATAPFAKDRPKGKSGAELFSHFCVECHPDGGNLLDPKKTLRKADREVNNIMTAEDIINKIWNVGPFAMHPESRLTMKRFNPATIPYEDALAIANYIKETFK